MHGLSSCGMSLIALRCVGSKFPEPGIQPTPPAVQDGLLTTGPPGKSWDVKLFKIKRQMFPPNNRLTIIKMKLKSSIESKSFKHQLLSVSSKLFQA